MKNIHKLSKKKIIPEGLVPPQALDLEERVLGSILTVKGAIKYVIDILTPECFYLDSHKKIYQAIVELNKERKPIDILTVTFALKAKGELQLAGGGFYISQLSNKYSTDKEHIKFHAQIIYDQYLRREVIKKSGESIKDAYGEEKSTEELLKEARNKINEIKEYQERDYSISVSLKEVLNHIASVEESGIAGLPTGYKKFDEWTGGFALGEVILIAGNPGSFKTGVSLEICHHNAGIGNPAFIFSQEMSDAQLGMREIAMHSNVPYFKIRKGELNHIDKDMINKSIAKIEKLPVYRDTSSGLTRNKLMNTVEKMTVEYGVKLFVIDYFQLMNHEVSKGENETTAMSKTTALMKVLAKQYNCVIIALSQLTKESRIRHGETPKRHYPSELRGTGSLEQDCDMLFFTWNPSNIKPGFVYDDGVKQVITDGKIALDVQKFRGGQSNALCWLKANYAINRFYDDELESVDFTSIQPDF